MLPERFVEAAEKARASLLDGDARKIRTWRTRGGKQISVSRGLAPEENRRDSIGYFLIVIADDSKAHCKRGDKTRTDLSTAAVEVIPAGSVDVRHPSRSDFLESKLQIVTSVGRLTIPSETDPQNIAWLNGEPIYPFGTPIPPDHR